MNKISIRTETVSDYEAIGGLISEVFRHAFGSGEAEAKLVAQLRQKPEYGPNISIIAEIGSDVVGQIFFSGVRLGEHPDIAACALAPLGVHSKYQKRGIGSQLVQRGLRECANQGYKAVFVQGSLQYYPRFGFIRIGDTRLHTIFNSDHDMVLGLENGILDKLSGLVEYPEPWDVFK